MHKLGRGQDRGDVPERVPDRDQEWAQCHIPGLLSRSALPWAAATP